MGSWNSRSIYTRATLDGHVESLTFFAGLDPRHQREKLLPDGAIEIIVDLSERPKALYAGEVMAANLAFFTAPLDLGGTIAASLAAGLGWAAISLWVISLFERRPFTYVLINGGYLTVGSVLMGVVLGLWK